MLKVTEFLKTENVNFPLNLNIYLHSVITEYVAHLKEELWQTTKIDNRIIDIIRLIEKDLDKNQPNEQLAEHVKMATNSFIKIAGYIPEREFRNIVFAGQAGY